MADTFAETWKAVRLHCPLATPFLVRYWVSEVYRRACSRRPWSFLRAESQFLTNAQKSGTVDVTRSSATVTGVGLTFASTDADRQFRVGSGVPYTISTVNVGANTCVLDRTYGGTTATATTATILDAYVTCPTDFARFIVVIDPSAQVQLNWSITDEELNTWDPVRTSTGSPTCLATRRYSSTSAQSGRIQYELWPYQTSAAHFPFYYLKQVAALSDDTSFLGPFANRSDIILTGALAEAASWPGLEDHKNPYFNLTLAAGKKAEFEDELVKLECRDEELYLTWLETKSWLDYPFAAVDPQTHDVHRMAYYA